MRKSVRRDDVPRHSSNQWELVTGWVDPVTDDPPDEAEEMRSDGDILGEVKGSGRRRALSSATRGTIPLEHQWEPDPDAFRPGQPSTFRQAAQIHSDWVNDILLCNQNQMLVSASSDGTVKAWSPHASPLSDPVTVGAHTDYVRCLAYSREQGWVASGSFDRTVKVWDLSRASQSSMAHPVMTLTPPDTSWGKGSIYALAVDPQGHMIVSGGPERVIRMWDPRAGKRIGKLVGHTDNIRAILVSEDSRCLLTASADASIKLWSLTSQRCLHTFTHHTDSVWALHSSHPSLEIFYSGDKSGFVARVDVEGCAQMSEAECALVCQDVGPPVEGVTKLIALDDTLVWTASGSSSLRRWRAPSRRAVRAAAPVESLASTVVSRTVSRLRPSRSTDLRPRSITLDLPPSPPHHRAPRHASSMSTTSPPTLEPPMTIPLDEVMEVGESTWFGLPYDCLVHLTSPLGDPFTPFSPVYRGRGAGADADVATLYSAASLMSVAPRPLMLRTPPLRGIFPSPPSPTHSPPVTGRPVSPAQSEFGPSASASGLGSGKPGNGGGGGISGGIGSSVGPHRAAFESREVLADAQPFAHVPDFVLVGGTGLVRAALLSNRVHALTVDTAGTVAVWDVVRAACVGQFAKEDVLLASNAHNTANSGSNSSRGGNKSDGGGLSGGGSASHHEPAEEASVCSPREALDIVRERIDGEAFVVPWSSVDTCMGVLNVNVDEHAFDAELYGDELGLPSDRVPPAGAGMSPEDVRVNLGKWILRNLFQGFIREEEQAHARLLRSSSPQIIGILPAVPSSPLPHPSQEPSPTTPSATTTASSNVTGTGTGTSSVVIVARNMLPAHPPNRPVGLGISHAPLPSTHTHTQLSPSLVAPAQAGGGDESTSTTQAHSQHHHQHPPQQPVQGGASSASSSAHQRSQTEVPVTTAAMQAQKSQDYFSVPTRRPSMSSGGAGAASAPAPVPTTPDESGPSTSTGATAAAGTSTGTGAGSGNGLATPGTPGGGLIGKLRGLGRTTKRTQNENAPGTPVPSTRPSAPATAATPTAPAAGTAASSSTQTPQETPTKQRTAAQVVLASGMLSPPTAADGPTLPLAQDTPLLVAEERAHGWATVYRGTVASAGSAVDVAALEDVMPVWLLEYLLLARAPQVAIVKIQFALLPGEDTLPELVNPNQTKLSASRFLRVRKLAAHVQERMETLGFGTSGPGTPPPPPSRPSSHSSHATTHADGTAQAASQQEQQQQQRGRSHSVARPEDVWDIVCNDTVLSPNVTLAVVRQYVWRQAGEVVLHYRRKRTQPPAAAVATTTTTGKN
ncbi:hypothetical protein BC827DRAFT_1219400 [Russula dissimulans]|nr:hypothetical protein BC827DRAFT_1219400 [Russula dissimulans]